MRNFQLITHHISETVHGRTKLMLISGRKFWLVPKSTTFFWKLNRVEISKIYVVYTPSHIQNLKQ